jgi:hypothetical protein
LATASSQTFSRVAAASRSRLNSAAAVATREEPDSAENLCHLGKGPAERGRAFGMRRGGLGPAGGGMIFGLWA